MKFPQHSGRYLLSHGKLLLRVARTEISTRYAGSLLGFWWSFLIPALTLAIYGTVYAIILAVRVPGMSSEQYVLFIFAGLVPFLMTAEALSLGASSVLANKAVLNNTVFPIDLAGPKAVLSSQLTMCAGMTFLLIGLAFQQQLHWTLILLPLIWILHLLFITGVVWLISIVAVVFRDIQSLMGAVVMMLFVASPIAYTPDMVPHQLMPLISLNPLAYFIVLYQKILVVGMPPGILEVLGVTILSIVPFSLGGWIFIRSKGVLADYV